MDTPDGTGALARLVHALPPSCGPVRLVGVDGHAGSGKTTFAARLAGALGGAPVLHLDDLATHDALFGWTEAFGRQVAGPLARGEPARFRIYDWQSRDFTRTGMVRPSPVVLVEGVGAGRRALRPRLACLVWADLPRLSAWERGRRRDGPELAGFWDMWERAEHAHFASDPSHPYANFLVRECGPEPEVRTGPAGPPTGAVSITESNN